MKRFALLLSLALAACSGSLPAPPRGSHAGVDYTVVPTMPPPGKVAVVQKPPPAMKKPVWIDGEWEWSGRRWQWKEGRWEDAPPGMYFAPTMTLRLADGTLAHYKGRWTKEAAQ